MLEMMNGSASGFPKNVVDESISERLNSGRALWRKSHLSNPADLERNETSLVSVISTCCCFREDVRVIVIYHGLDRKIKKSVPRSKAAEWKRFLIFPQFFGIYFRTMTMRMKTQQIKPRRKRPALQKVYFFSDAHLGLGSRQEDHQKEQRLIRFLDFIQHDAGQVFIVGDLFDYWFEYKSVVPKKYFRLFSKLAALTERHIRVSFIAGNHDFWVKDYFRDELGMEVHLNPLEMDIYGKRFLIHHGDGLLKDDIGYRILKKILRNKLSIFLFSLIHPDITGWAARWSSRTSRQYTNTRTYEESGMVEFAARQLENGFDFVVMGHNHVASHQKLGPGVYVNLGDWIFENTYAVFDGKTLELKKWAD